ncbi:MAG TPA: phosphatidate cytidylyltransferase [Acidocella sp.]|uniref:phosphatidate cytidylyltransferase n=1 Tax=Acidocella sp. TaxID=50710 RepID=UPI002C6C5663|nr:phosphatidate cytidylyltransferase [Acidocella sp.]HVE20364.1 phosphatidate cytidylyltransferase [Acidocella sp.]
MRVLPDMSASTANGRWSDFGIRLLSAAILGPVVLACVWSGGIAWTILVELGLLGLGLEWARLMRGDRRLLVLLPLALVLSGVVAMVAGYPAALAVMALLTVLIALRFGLFMAIGLPYAGIGGLALLWLRLQPHRGLHDTLFLLIVVWGTDIGAYLVGRVVGGARLAPRISPGKTWSGSLGGLVIGGFCGAVVASGLHGLDALALLTGGLLSIFAQAGDLLESAIKRKLGVKDSGRTIPGHGGLFDRLDGFLAAAPVAVILALSVHGGLPLWG